MQSEMADLLTGVIVSNEQMLSLSEVCDRCALPAEHIIKMIGHGILEPQDSQISCSHWKFSGDSLLRVQTTLRLQHDLGLNLAGAALALDLLEEVKLLRQTVASLQRP
jgi:chaperone modulatory protein CbpM